MREKRSLAAEGCQNRVGQGLEERIGNHEIAFGDADPRLADRLPLKGPDFRHGPIAVAKHQRFSCVDVKALHDYIVDY